MSSIHIKSSQRHLPAAIYPQTSSYIPVEAEALATTWTASFNRALQDKDFGSLGDLFFEESYWRDQLCLSWDYRTLRGSQNMIKFLERHRKGSRLNNLSIDASDLFHKPKMAPIDHDGKFLGLQAFLIIDTDVGNGKGLVRLVQDEKSRTWKAFTLFTAMYELRDHEETVKHRRPLGLNYTIPGEFGEPKNWQEWRVAQENFLGSLEPTVLIIGARS